VLFILTVGGVFLTTVGLILGWQGSRPVAPQTTKTEPQKPNSATHQEPTAQEIAEEVIKRLGKQDDRKVSASHLSPHLHVTGINFTVPDAATGHAEAKVIFLNDGSAPARVLTGGRMAWYIDQGDPLKRYAFEDSLFLDEPRTDIIHYPNAFDIPQGSDRSVTLASSPWEGSAVTAFANGGGTVYVAGTLLYTDGKRSCRSTYCMYIGRDGQAKFCVRHNEEPACK
jgi:hypothetical protein